MKKNPEQEALREILLRGYARTQADIQRELENSGFEINQSKISRLLSKLGAVKTRDMEGEVIYRLPREPGPPTKETPLTEMVIDVVDNGQLCVIYTSPGSASMIARLLDYQQTEQGILATVAGDDTILVIPSDPQKLRQMVDKIKGLLY